MAAFNCIQKLKKEENKWQMRARFPSSCPWRAVSRRGQFPGIFAAWCLFPAAPAVPSPSCRWSRRQSRAGHRGGPGPAPPWGGEALSAWPSALNSGRWAAGMCGREGGKEALPAWTPRPAFQRGQHPSPGQDGTAGKGPPPGIAAHAPGACI